MRATINNAGYDYCYFDRPSGAHVLYERATGRYEAWYANKNHASYGLIYKNTHLEFAHEVEPEEAQKTIRELQNV